MAKRQKVLALYLKFPSLEAEVISWATFDGTGKKLHMTGDSDEPPYPTGLDALLDGQVAGLEWLDSVDHLLERYENDSRTDSFSGFVI